MIPDMRKFAAGDRVLSAGELNVIKECVRLLTKLGGANGLSVDSVAGVLNVLGPGMGGAGGNENRQTFWGEITEEGNGSGGYDSAGYYAWKEMELLPNGTFAAPQGRPQRKGALRGESSAAEGVAGTVVDPARDISDKTGVPVGLRVLMMPAPVAVGGKVGNWRFITPDLVQVLRFGSGTTNADGDFDGYVMRHNNTTGQFFDAEQCWITVP
jgi:hypothetical protein